MPTQTPQMDAVTAQGSERERVAKLLTLYPKVSDGEVAQIIAFLRKGAHLDVGILTGDDRLKSKLDAFMADHKQHFRLKIVEVCGAFGGIVALMLLLWLVWETVR